MLIEPLGCWSHQPHSLQPWDGSVSLMLLMALTAGAANTASPPSLVAEHRAVPSSTAKEFSTGGFSVGEQPSHSRSCPLPGWFSSTSKGHQNNPKTGPDGNQMCQIGDLLFASGPFDIPPNRTEPNRGSLATCSLSTSSSQAIKTHNFPV